MSSPELNETHPLVAAIERQGAQAELEALEEFAAMQKPSLREKLSRVAAHCAHIDKDGWNEFHRYHYVTAGAVFRAVNEALEVNRLVSLPHFSREGSDTFSMVMCRLEIHDLDSPEVLWTTAYGSGYDKGDKAVMKGQTAALKYCWMMLLNISSGDDPEADSTTDSRASGEPIKPRQTPEEYQAKVERNKTAPLSPLAVKLSEQIIKELADEGVGLPEEPHLVLDQDHCPCGSTLITKVVKGVPKQFCELADLAGNYEWAVKEGKDPRQGARAAFQTLEKMHKQGFNEKEHVKFRPKK